jgi:hypothetical protein
VTVRLHVHVRRQAIKLGYDLRVLPSKTEQPSARSAPAAAGFLVVQAGQVAPEKKCPPRRVRGGRQVQISV